VPEWEPEFLMFANRSTPREQRIRIANNHTNGQAKMLRLADTSAAERQSDILNAPRQPFKRVAETYERLHKIDKADSHNTDCDYRDECTH
jgi:hypothetical protein